MSMRSHCSSCGAALQAGGGEGLCTPCLLSLGLNRRDEPNATANGNGVEVRTGDEASSPRDEEPALCRFGDFELLRERARGGMGIVYEARQISLNRLVAVKRVLAGRLATPELLQRFRAEASAAAHLRHPNIVTIHEVGVHQGEPYLAMDLIQGPNLAERVGHEPMDARWAARLIRDLAQAVHYAHKQRILHRDLKPSNVLLDQEDRPYVTDFGLAKRWGEDSDLTLTGQVIGSPNYMSPEQAAGRRGQAGPSGDIYSLGAVLYHVLTAHPPFQAFSPAETMHQLLHEEPLSPRLWNPEVPRDLETICLKALAKDPDRRYPTAQAMAEDLDRYLNDEPIKARPAGRWEKVVRWSRRNPAAASMGALTVLVLVAVSIGSTVAAWRIHRERQRANASLYAADLNLAARSLADGDLNTARQLLTRHQPLFEQGESPAFEWRYLWGQSRSDGVLAFTGPRAKPFIGVSRDGRWVAMQNQVWDLRTRESVATLPDDYTSLAFAQDHLLARYDYSLWQVDLHTWEREALAGRALVRAVAFSADGRWMATGTERSLDLWTWMSGKWTLTNSRPLVFLDWHNAKTLAFAPDGGTLATATGAGYANESRLALWSVPSLSPRPGPLQVPRQIAALSFAPSGALLAGLWNGDMHSWELNGQHWRERPTALRHRGAVVDMMFSPTDTNLLATLGSEPAIRLWDYEKQTESAVLRTEGRRLIAMDFSPDGQTLVTCDLAGNIKLWSTRPRSHENALLVESTPPALLGFVEGHLVTLNRDGLMKHWRVSEREEIRDKRRRVDLSEIAPSNFGSYAPALSSDGAWLALGLTNGIVRVHPLNNEEARQWQAHDLSVRNQAWATDTGVLATCGDDLRVRLWDVQAHRSVAEFEVVGPWPDHTFRVPMIWSSDGTMLAVADWEHLYLWRHSSPETVQRIDLDSTIHALKFLPGDEALVSVHRTRVFQIWNAADGRLLNSQPTGHADGIRDVAITPDGRTMATVVDQVKLWSMASRQEAMTLTGHDQTVFAARFTPDGNALITSDYEGRVMIWPAPSWEEIRRGQSEILGGGK